MTKPSRYTRGTIRYTRYASPNHDGPKPRRVGTITTPMALRVYQSYQHRTGQNPLNTWVWYRRYGWYGIVEEEGNK